MNKQKKNNMYKLIRYIHDINLQVINYLLLYCENV